MVFCQLFISTGNDQWLFLLIDHQFEEWLLISLLVVHQSWKLPKVFLLIAQQLAIVVLPLVIELILHPLQLSMLSSADLCELYQMLYSREYHLGSV